MKTLQARPTTYRGVEMRSRLEARFAAGMDTLGVEWQYEPRCFADGRKQYLPDFQLDPPDGLTYVEVKPTLELAFEALPKGDIIMASVAPAEFVVATPELGDFLLIYQPWCNSVPYALGCWSRMDFEVEDGGGHHTAVQPLYLPSGSDPTSGMHLVAAQIRDREMPKHFDWSWQ